MTEDSYLIILGVVIVILFIALLILTYKVFDLQHRMAGGNKLNIPEEKSAQTKTEQKIEHREEEREEQKIAEPKNTVIRDINLTEGISDISESMRRYTIKYHLDSATLASMDGFLIASSHADSEREAANLTARYRENAMTEVGDTHITPLSYRGEEILLIFRTTQQVTKERAEMMIRDGRSILSHWL
ncbi:hypothetical protein [Methanogenium sp. MK-MG]|uniref:hypothetical protein n=1 Tax=Methanogenium sp. MK-MG TaxID=2599926 RepID=UPI0013EDEC95|nr:hypothetical protein [Methanogenium sp. MK-MG]KAF1078904.1 hypothetical protein MKMG_00172 [Methanogenium sp. MK-MG]